MKTRIPTTITDNGVGITRTKLVSLKRSFGRRAAFSMIELMVALCIAMVVLTSLASLTLYTARSMASIGNYCDLEQASRYTLDLFTSDVRQVAAVSSFSSTKVVFTETDGSLLTYEYVPSTRSFVRSRAGLSRTLLNDCDSVEFRLYQRNPIEGTRDLVATTDASEGKALEVTWYCSKTLKGVRANTEHMQTARVTIRKQKAT